MLEQWISYKKQIIKSIDVIIKNYKIKLIFKNLVESSLHLKISKKHIIIQYLFYDRRRKFQNSGKKN